MAADESYVTGNPLALTVAAAKTGYTAPADVTRDLTVDLIAPAKPGYTVPDTYTLTVGVAAETLTTAGGSGIDSYSAEGLPAGLTIDPDSGTISGAPSAAGVAGTVTVTVSDTAGNTAEADALPFPAVAKGSQDLSGFGYTPTSLDYGAATPVLTAPKVVDGAALTYTSTTTTVCTVADDGALSLLTDGACTVRAATEATDNYNAAEQAVTVTVNPVGTLTWPWPTWPRTTPSTLPRRRPASASPATPAPRPASR